MNTGQMLVLAGPPNAGKSFDKEFIIRPILGGRHTDPAPSLQGKTNFNKDTLRAEAWEIDDQVGASDSEKRKMLTGAIKKLTASNDQRVEGKYADAFQPPPVYHRLTIYTNDDSYSLWVLPEMNDSTRDKAIILKVDKPENPTIKLPTIEERPAFREEIEKQLPAFVYKLTKWGIPEEIADTRYGVKAYQHPELKEKLHDMSEEGRLQRMINLLLFEFQPLDEPWDGSISQLWLALKDRARYANMTKELDKVIWNPEVLGSGLGKLKGPNNQVEQKRKDWKGNRGWIIYPPGWSKEDKEAWKTRRAQERQKTKQALETPGVKNALKAMEERQELDRKIEDEKWKVKCARKTQKTLESEEARKAWELSEALDAPGVRETLDKLKQPEQPIGEVMAAPGVMEALEAEKH